MHTFAFEGSIQLFPDGTIFIHIALILLMIWVLNRTYFRPVNKIIESREKFKNIQGGEAGNIETEALEKETAYSRQLLEARSEGYALIEKEHGKLVRAREKKLSETKAEIGERMSVEKGELDRQTQEARVTIGTDAEKLADQIAATVLKG
jgi:F0F1-type ATP synthase membrane subunit b/b'